jgi:flavin-dependent dehydrogenase
VYEREFFDIHWKMTSDLHFDVCRDYPLVSMVMRDAFDAALVREAFDKGAEVHDEENFRELTFSDQSVTVRTDKQSYHARYLIAADGALSPVYRFLKLEDKRFKVPAVEAEIELSSNNHPLFEKVIFDITAISQGYGWVFPKANHLSIGVAAMPSASVSLNQSYKSYVNSLNLNGDIVKEKKYGFQIPLFPHKELSYRNVLFTGDAAGLADPLVAEGISHALFSGKWAAESIMNYPKYASKMYDQRVRHELSSQIKSARILARIFYDYPGVSKWIMERKGDYITNYVSDIFAGKRRYPDNMAMLTKSFRKLF